MQAFKWAMACISFVAIVCCSSMKQGNAKPKVLVFSKTTGGFRHESIGAGQAAIFKLGGQHGFLVDTTEDASRFTEANLSQFAAVVFLSTSGNMLDASQEAAFERFIRNGGGFVGIHGASAGEYEWNWYGKMLGAYFDGHPKVQPARVVGPDKKFAATGHLPETWEKADEWYNYKQWNSDNVVVLRLDEASYEGGTMNGDHPIAWYKEFEGGRTFYTGLGHTIESYSDPLFTQHLAQGILYAIGQKK